MSRKLTVTLDTSSNGDVPVMVVATESFGFFNGNNMDVINTVVGDRALELYNELTKKSGEGRE
jgi:hypothetical protein